MDAGIDAVTTTVSVTEDISGIEVPCYLLCGSELIYATAKNSGNFTSCDRGAGGTTAAAHSNGASVYSVYGANLFNQLKRAIIAIQTELGLEPSGSHSTVTARFTAQLASLTSAGNLDFPTSSELVIATGAVVPTLNWHTIDTEADAASDDLDTLTATNATDGFVLFLRANNTGRTVVIKHNTGNIVSCTGSDITLDETYKLAIGIYDSTLSKWVMGTLNIGGSGGGDKYPCEAKLTLETGVANSTTDQNAKATVYLTKFKGNQVAVYDGSSAWTTLSLGSDLSITLSTLSTSLPHDIFAYNSSGSLAIEGLAWTNATTRATALTLQDGILVKSGATTRRYIGTVYLDASKQCYDSVLHRWVWNYYNRTDKFLYKDVDTSHTYTSTTFRYYNNDTSQYVDAVIGVAEDIISFSIGGQWGAITAGTDTGYAAIGVDGTTTRLSPQATSSINGRNVAPIYSNAHGVGYHTFTMLEAATNSVDFGNYTLSGIIKA